jgi:hypothetical protein
MGVFSQYQNVVTGGAGGTGPGNNKGFIGWTPDPNHDNGGGSPPLYLGNANANITVPSTIGSAGKAQSQVVNTNNQ